MLAPKTFAGLRDFPGSSPLFSRAGCTGISTDSVALFEGMRRSCRIWSHRRLSHDDDDLWAECSDQRRNACRAIRWKTAPVACDDSAIAPLAAWARAWCSASEP